MGPIVENSENRLSRQSFVLMLMRCDILKVLAWETTKPS